MLDSLDALSGSPWAYALILAVAAVDAFFPVVPSEATVVTAGVFAAVGDLSLALVIAAGAIRFRFLRFGVYALVAATLWATYAGLVGYLGGRAFAEQPLLAVGAALAGVALVALLVEGVRRLRVSPCAA